MLFNLLLSYLLSFIEFPTTALIIMIPRKTEFQRTARLLFLQREKYKIDFFFLLSAYGVSIVVINLSYLLTKILLPFSFCLIVLAILLTKEFKICRLYLTFAINHAAQRFRCLSENTISLCVRQLRCASIHLYLRCFCIQICVCIAFRTVFCLTGALQTGPSTLESFKPSDNVYKNKLQTVRYVIISALQPTNLYFST